MTKLASARAGRSSVWTAPAILGVLIGIGLITALVRDGLWDVLACTLLTGALGYACLAALTRRS
ncbi:hypothetical protein ACQVP2_32445 [Methylobacterium aquaticum]|jgi:hypothetical protein|uniref:hypothetical protein n=1 Tax=Methylobacterium aquaticum TaxID=270351 RepID=UPI0012E26BB0|nr:hypothetical protein [Methylobacterium aquaticum]